MTAIVERAQCIPSLLGGDAEEWLSSESVVIAWGYVHPPRTLSQWSVEQFPVPSRAMEEAQRQAKCLSLWTGWSSRTLAKVLDTTHTTVLGLQRGRPLQSHRSGELNERLVEAYQLIERIHQLAEADPQRTVRALSAPEATGVCAIEHLRARRPARAYLAALDALRPRQSGMLTGSRPARGDATTPLTE